MNHDYLVREIILKYHRGETLTDEEQAILDTEMAQLPADKVWERIRSHLEKNDAAVIRPWYARWPAVTAGAAAVVVLIAGVVYRSRSGSERVLAMQPVWRMVAPGHYSTEVTGPEGVVVIDSAGGRQSVPYPVLLPDGSQVTLSYRSSVRYVKSFVKREVGLLGQGCFDVIRNEKPFEVAAGNRIVEVLGTQFNWMHYPGVPDEITLRSGKIRLVMGKFQKELQPAERAVIDEGATTRVRVQKMERPEESMAWTSDRPSIKFDSTDLYTVIQRMAQYYQVGYYVAPGLRTGSPITGVVDLGRSLEENLAPIREMTKGYADVEDNNGMIEVTK
jgi:hypothetical protein